MWLRMQWCGFHGAVWSMTLGPPVSLVTVCLYTLELMLIISNDTFWLMMS